MRLELDREALTVRQALSVKITHGDNAIYWDASSFDKRVMLSEEYDVYKHINEYWDSLPGYKQEKIFLEFEKIRNIFDDVADTGMLIHSLLQPIHDIFEEHKLEDIHNWMVYKSDIMFPYKLDEVYVASDEKPGNREKTYLKSDYYQLLSMTIALRVMIPVWGEFIYRTKRETGTLFKEFYAYQLLSKTHLANSEAMEKLKIYVINNIQLDKLTSASIINGVGSEDYPTWLLSKVLVCRICIGDTSGTNQTSSLVTYIWNFINHKVNNSNTGSYALMVKDKDFENADTLSDHNTSRLEGYKIKTELALGTTTVLEHYMSNPYIVATQLKPNINLDLLNLFLHNSNALNNEQIWRSQVALAQYVLKPVMSPRGIVHLTKKKVITAIAIAQTCLWENGHKILACLISAIATDNENSMLLSGLDSRARIPKDIMDELNILYPFNKVSAQKKKGKVSNVIVSAIDELSQLFSQRDWILTVSDEQMVEVFGKANVRRYSCPHDIKILLAKLIVDLAKSR